MFIDEAREVILERLPQFKTWKALQEHYPTADQLFNILQPGNTIPLNQEDIGFLYAPDEQGELDGDSGDEVMDVSERDTHERKQLSLRLGRLSEFVYGS
jgi:hypothetical protein